MHIQSLTKYQKRNCTGFGGNNIAKCIDDQILANTLILKLKYNENINVILPTDILLMLMKSITSFCSHLTYIETL